MIQLSRLGAWSLISLLQVAAVSKPDTCSLGFGSSCLLKTELSSSASSTYRMEAFSGYKSKMSYYKDEQDNCRLSPDCELSPEGLVYGVDLYFNQRGNNYSDDYLDLGVQYVSIPVAKIDSKITIEGSNDTNIGAGQGELRYHFLRLNAKRGHFLYLLKSKYLISSFGVGIGIPQASGTGEDFPGGKNIVPSIGGKLGFQFPLLANLDIGLATNWSVLWYGNQMSDSAFISGYGVNMSYRL